MSEYQLRAVPDIITPDGRVRRWTLYGAILRDRRRVALATANWVLVTAVRESRFLTGDEQRQLDKLAAEVIALNKRIARS